MKRFKGVWFPDHEVHMIHWMGRNGVPVVDGFGTYQWNKQEACYKLLDELKRPCRVAVDVGAHVGLWTMHMAKRFQRVEAFEPYEMQRRCLERNVERLSNVRIWPVALGAKDQAIDLITEQGSSGATRVAAAGEFGEPARMTRLDSIVFSTVFDAPIDFIKIDCEGYEENVCIGAEQTIRKWKPVIIVEQKNDWGAKRYQGAEQGALKLLLEWGAVQRWEYSGDHLLSW